MWSCDLVTTLLRHEMHVDDSIGSIRHALHLGHFWELTHTTRTLVPIFVARRDHTTVVVLRKLHLAALGLLPSLIEGFEPVHVFFFVRAFHASPTLSTPRILGGVFELFPNILDRTEPLKPSMHEGKGSGAVRCNSCNAPTMVSSLDAKGTCTRARAARDSSKRRPKTRRMDLVLSSIRTSSLWRDGVVKGNNIVHVPIAMPPYPPKATSLSVGESHGYSQHPFKGVVTDTNTV